MMMMMPTVVVYVCERIEERVRDEKVTIVNKYCIIFFKTVLCFISYNGRILFLPTLVIVFYGFLFCLGVNIMFPGPVLICGDRLYLLVLVHVNHNNQHNSVLFREATGVKKMRTVCKLLKILTIINDPLLRQRRFAKSKSPQLIMTLRIYIRNLTSSNLL